MCHLRIKIWWLMVLVAVVAICIPGWRWHHQMLRRSNANLQMAAALDRTLAGLPSRAATYARYANPAINAGVNRRYTRFAVEMANQARVFRHAATFPWLYGSRRHQ